MDSLTHAVLGACVGEALAGRKLGKKAMLYGAIANNIPDIDLISSLWMNPAESLLAHRGFTHSILFVLIMTPLAGWMIKKLFPENNFSQQEWSVLIGINLLLHIFIDSFTVYGTGWFEPFSHYRVSFNLLFVADPFYTLALIIASIALLVLKNSSSKRFAWTTAGLALSSLYIVYALYHKLHVDRVAEKSLSKEKILYRDFMATPAPLNNFLWYVMARTDSGYSIGYYSVFDRENEITFHSVSRNDSLLATIQNKNELNKLIRFSRGYYQFEKVNDTLVFEDLRFGQIGGWDTGDAPFVFQYRLTENAANRIAVQSGRLKASSGKALWEMIERIRGK